MKPITLLPGEPRASYLMRAAAAHITAHAEDDITVYDEAECDGQCLSSELLQAAEEIRAEVPPTESVPPPDSRFDFRPHGWHWWRGKSGAVGLCGIKRPAQWHVVHCWIAEGDDHVPMATSAHFPEPLTQAEMTKSGIWGPPVIPPARA